MPKTPETVAAFFRAMQTGQAAEADMKALFAPDATYIEPFSGAPKTHKGRDKIIATMRAGWKFNPPDMRITLDDVSVDGEIAVVHWTCYSSALPGGKGSGINRFTFRNGLIAKLETTL